MPPDTTRIAKAIIEFGGENPEFAAMVTDTAKKLAGLTQNFRDTGSELDKMAAGMTKAGKSSGESMSMIGRMSQSGREELKRLSTAAEEPVSAFSKIVGALGPIPTMIAGAFSVTAIIGFAKEMGGFAGHIADLSDETSISTTRLQAWNYLVGDAGLTIDDFATSVQQLQKRLAGDDDSAVAAVEHLGLSVEQLLAMTPDEAFIQIAEAAAKLTNHGEQTTVMFDLMGRTGSKALRLVRDDLGETISKIEHSGGVIDENLIRTADKFDEAWSHAWMRFRAGVVNFLGDDGNAFREQMGAIPVRMPTVAGPASLGPIGAKASITGPTKEELKALDDQAAKLRENIAAWEQHKKAAADWTAEVTGAKALAAIQELQDRFVALTPAQKANKDTVAAVLAEYVKLEQRVGLGVVPVLDQLYQSKGLVTERARELTRQLMLTQVEVDLLQPSVGALIPPLLETSDAFDMSTQQAARATFGMGQYGVQADQLAHEKIPNTWEQVDNLARSFEQLANISGPSMGEVTRSIGMVIGATATAHTSWKSFTSGFDSFKKEGSDYKDILGGLTGIVGGIGGIVAAAQAAVSVIKALFNAFKSEESLKVNNPRAAFQDQFGGHDALAGDLTNTLVGLGEEEAGNKAEALLRAMNEADTEAKWKAAQQAIADVFGRGGRNIQTFAAGGIATRPTLGVFGEAGDEALIPLDRLNSIVGQRETTQTIILNLDGRELARSTVRHFPRELSMAGLA